MKDNDFALLADEALSPLEWNDQQRLVTLRLMRQPERMPMKKKLALCIVCALMLAGLATAVAVGTRSATTLEDFFASPANLAVETLVVPVEASAIATPSNPRHTSRWVDIEVTQMYMYEEKLYIVTHITPQEANTVLYDDTAGVAYVDGEALRYYDLYLREELTILTLGTLNIDPDDVDDAYAPDRQDSIFLAQQAIPDETGGGLTVLSVFDWSEGLMSLQTSTPFPLKVEFYVSNARTHQYEPNVFFVDVPQMQAVTEAE